MVDISDMAALAGDQHGLVSISQLSNLGFGHSGRQNLVRSGILRPVCRGVKALVGAAATWEQALMAAILRPGAPVTASHRSALRLWGLRTRFEGFEVTVRLPANRRIPGVRVHRSVDLEPEDIVVKAGIPTTSLTRTLCDAGLIFPPGEVQRLVDHAVAGGLTTAAELMAIRRRVSEHGRNGVVKLETAVDGLPSDDTGVESGPEARLLSLLVGAGLPRPDVQHPVSVNGRSYRIDLAYPKYRLGIEYDGFEVHSGLDAFTSDRRRQNDLVGMGWTIRRYTHSDLRDRPEAIVAEVRRHINSFD